MLLYCSDEELDRFKEEAKETASRLSIAPFSNYHVGACLWDGEDFYHGGNLEFANYSNTIHAEEMAICDMHLRGCDPKSIVCLIVWVSGEKCYFPCGMCRQSLFEIFGKDLTIIAVSDTEEKIGQLGDLLPEGFSL